jgi:hypothetical protein
MPYLIGGRIRSGPSLRSSSDDLRGRLGRPDGRRSCTPPWVSCRGIRSDRNPGCSCCWIARCRCSRCSRHIRQCCISGTLHGVFAGRRRRCRRCWTCCLSTPSMRCCGESVAHHSRRCRCCCCWWSSRFVSALAAQPPSSCVSEPASP